MQDQADTGDSRFAPFRNAAHSLTGGSSAFHSVVYFINTNYMNELRWGTTEPIIVQDPEEDVNVHVRAFGLFGVHIEQNDSSLVPIQARKFLVKVVGTRDRYTREELTSFMRAKILEYVPDLLAKAIVDQGVSVLKIATHLSDFSSQMQGRLVNYFDEFGLTLDNFSFNSIKPFEDDLAAINEMKIQRKRSILEAQGNAAQMDIESEALARKRAREGYDYQQERGMDVMQSAAGNEGSAASGLMGAGMGLGMGVGMGGAFGAGFSNLANQTLGTVAPMVGTTPASASMQTVPCAPVAETLIRWVLSSARNADRSSSRALRVWRAGILTRPVPSSVLSAGTGWPHQSVRAAELSCPRGPNFAPIAELRSNKEKQR